MDWEAWREAAERDLKGVPLEKLAGRTADGIVVQPLYTEDHPEPPSRAGQYPGLPPFTRGRRPAGTARSGWWIAQAVEDGDRDVARRAMAYDLEHGATAFRLRLGSAGRRGVHVASREQLAELLQDVDLERTALFVDAGLGGLDAGPALAELAAERGHDPAALRGCLGVDPLGELAGEGELPLSLEEAWSGAAELAAWAKVALPSARPLLVSTRAYAEGGAPPALELALALATGVEMLRRLEAAGLDPDDAAAAVVFELAAGRDLFADLAKLRAARMLWARITELSGVEEMRRGMLLWLRGVQATKTRRDPWVNLLRATVETFVGAVGGAEGITVPAFDAPLGRPEELGRRLAAHTQVILAEESHLAASVDPAGGSWYVEHLTVATAEKAWEELQSIEAGGGLQAMLGDGRLAGRVAEAARATAVRVARRKEPITGVSSYPHLGEEPVEREPRGEVTAPAFFEERFAALRGYTDVARAPRIGAFRWAAGFEALRDASDAALRETGSRPRAFLASLGRIPVHRARTEFARNAFEAGGIEPLVSDGYPSPESAAEAFAASGAPIAAICSSDEVYAEQAEATAKAVVERGARSVVLAGRPGDAEEALRAAGVDHFIHVGCDLEGTLRTLLQALGVIR
jgi:methylmalonyl-CoA mutase